MCKIHVADYPYKYAQKCFVVSYCILMTDFSIRGKNYNCFIAFTLDLISGKWKTLILWYLIEGKKRFGELQKLLPRCSQRMLTRQLRELEAKLTARLDGHEAAIVDMLQRIMRLLDPPPEPEPPKRQIGFGLRERRAVYRVNCRGSR